MLPNYRKNLGTMIPLRYIAETLGGKVTWNAQGQRIKIEY